MDSFKLIPQIFYDMIARVIPGGVAIFAISAALNLKVGAIIKESLEGASALQGSALVMVMAFLISAYLIGHLVVPLSDLLHRIMSELDVQSSFHLLEGAVSDRKRSEGFYSEVPLKGIKDSLIELIKEEGEMGDMESLEPGNRKYTDIIFLWYDRLRKENPDIGERLTKLRAEHEMHRALAVVLIIAFLLHIVWVPNVQFNSPFLIVTFIGFILSALGVAKTYWRFQMSTIQHYHIQRKAKEDTDPPAKAKAASGGQ